MRNFIILALLFALPASAQDLATTVKATQAAAGIYMLEGVDGFSSNIGLMVGDEVLAIDGQRVRQNDQIGPLLRRDVGQELLISRRSELRSLPLMVFIFMFFQKKTQDKMRFIM